MDPFTIALIASVGISIVGELMGASAKKDALERQAKFEESAAAIALQDAAYDVWRSKMQGAAKVGSARVAFAASGVDTATGTAADTLSQLATVGNMEEYAAELKGSRIAWTHQQRAKLLRAGVSDVDAAMGFNIASEIVGAGSKYAASGSVVNKNSAIGGPAESPIDSDGLRTLGNIVEF